METLLVWFFGPKIEVGRRVLSKLSDPALQPVLREAHAERWGIFVGLAVRDPRQMG